MSLSDVVKCEMKDHEFCKKYPSSDLRTSSLLVVYPLQTAIFVREGQVCDMFGAGTYSLNADHLTTLDRLIGLPSAPDSPFQADIWFINHASKLNTKWDTTRSIPLKDPKYGIVVPVRVCGQYGIRVVDAMPFMQTLNDNLTDFSAYKVAEFFKALMLSNLPEALGRSIVQNQLSILDIDQYPADISAFCREEIDRTFQEYGIQLSEFAITSVSTPNDDPSVIKLMDAKDLTEQKKPVPAC